MEIKLHPDPCKNCQVMLVAGDQSNLPQLEADPFFDGT